VPTDITVDFANFNPNGRAVQQQAFVQFLVDFIISNNENKLRKLYLRNVNFGLCSTSSGEGALLDASQRILMAAAESRSLNHLTLGVADIPVQVLADFCRANRNVKVLKIWGSFSSGGSHSPLDLPAAITKMNTLFLWRVDFIDQEAARTFAELVRHMKFRVLQLQVGYGGDEEALARMMSSLVNPSVEYLELRHASSHGRRTEIDLFRSALAAGKATLGALSVIFDVLAGAGKRALWQLKKISTCLATPSRI